jgi:preprotein translocase subunit SecD
MRGNRSTSYAVLVAALAVTSLAACGSSSDGGPSSSSTGTTSSTTASPAPTSAGQGDLQLRQATSAQTPAAQACTSGPVAPETPTYRCDRDGAGYQLGPAFVTGAMVASAQAQMTASGPVVEVVLNPVGTKALAAATTRMAALGPPGNLLGTMSGGQLYGAPQVQSPVVDGVFVIGGLANMPDAVSLAASIRG